MMRYTCPTCKFEGRTITMNAPKDTGPTMAEIRRAHRGVLVLDFGDHRMVADPDTSTLEGWLEAFGGARVLLDLDMDQHEGDKSPHIVVRYQGRVMVLNVMTFAASKDDREPYLDIDVHAFVDGKTARTGVFGMEDGFRASLDDDQVKGTSHGWAATKLVALLLGKQEDK